MSVWLWRQIFAPWFLGVWGAHTAAGDAAKVELVRALQQLARQERLPAPELFFVRDFAPNVYFLLPNPRASYFVMSEALMRILSQKEIEAVFLYGLQEMRFRQFRVAAWVMLALFSLSRLFFWFPKGFALLLRLWPQALVKVFLSPERFRKVDKYFARDRAKAVVLVAAMQKSSAVLRKITALEQSHWTWGYVAWICASQQQWTHPVLDTRIGYLLSLRSLDK